MSALEPVEARLSALIASLSAPERKKLASSIARKLRASQQRNIKLQQAPDGTPFKPRKKQPLRGKKGRIKRDMFTRLRTAKYMKSKGTGDDAAVEFAGRVQRMVRVHHYGLRDRAAQGGKEVQYEARPLLGFSDDDIEMVEDIILNHLSTP